MLRWKSFRRRLRCRHTSWQGCQGIFQNLRILRPPGVLARTLAYGRHGKRAIHSVCR